MPHFVEIHEQLLKIQQKSVGILYSGHNAYNIKLTFKLLDWEGLTRMPPWCWSWVVLFSA